MCNRYYVELSPELRPIIEAARQSSMAARMLHDLGRPVAREGEVRPTDIAAVLAPNTHGLRTVFPMVWGFTLPENPNTKRSAPLINCRIETAESKPLWKESWFRRRCIIPASWYFEWEHLLRPDGRKKTGDKYVIQPKNSTITWLAGLYRMEEGFPHFTVLTREPGDEIRFIHDRMPVILPEEAIAEWINPEASPEAINRIAAAPLTDMVFAKA